MPRLPLLPHPTPDSHPSPRGFSGPDQAPPLFHTPLHSLYLSVRPTMRPLPAVLTSPSVPTTPRSHPRKRTNASPPPPSHYDAPSVAYTSPPTPYCPSYDACTSPSHILMPGIAMFHWLSAHRLPSPPLPHPTPTPYRSPQSFTRQDQASPYAILYRIHSIYL
jgi:hypothetical protein